MSSTSSSNKKDEEKTNTDTTELPAHYYQYKGNFARCAAIQIIFEYFSMKEMIKTQILSKRFYNRIMWICPKVPVSLRAGYTEIMKQQTSIVMLFENKGNMYTFSSASDYKWRTEALVITD